MASSLGKRKRNNDNEEITIKKKQKTCDPILMNKEKQRISSIICTSSLHNTFVLCISNDKSVYSLGSNFRGYIEHGKKRNYYSKTDK